MLFVEFRFFAFFLAVFLVYWGLQKNATRKVWLLAASYFFYSCWDWRFLGILLTSTTLDYGIGLALQRSQNATVRKVLVVTSLTYNLGLIAFFKYCNFFITSAVSFLAWFGLPAHISTLNIVIPVGVSFFTFQSMSYTLDIYRRRMPAVESALDLAFFIAFFPQLVAGPIVRASTFLPQLSRSRRWSDVDFRGAISLFLIGFIKKACISESIAPFVDQFFAQPTRYTALSGWLAVLLYAVQIYADFSGYTDMACACARLLGYELTKNFAFPYFSANITDFWRRWHMSLSTWLRDYLYISLGGNRGSLLFIYRNLFLTMLLGGLWHGGAWTFVIWGALHGVALIIHKEWLRIRQSQAALREALYAIVACGSGWLWLLFTRSEWFVHRNAIFGVLLALFLIESWRTWYPQLRNALLPPVVAGGSLFCAAGALAVALFCGHHWQISGKVNGSMVGSAAGFAALTYLAIANVRWSPKILSALKPLAKPASILLTFGWVCLAWIFFRAQTLGAAISTVGICTFLTKSGDHQLEPALWPLFGSLALIHFLNSKGVFSNYWRRLSWPVFAVGLGFSVAVILLFVPTHYKPFIYFQF